MVRVQVNGHTEEQRYNMIGNFEDYRKAISGQDFRYLEPEVPPGGYMVLDKLPHENATAALENNLLLNRITKGSIVNIFEEGFYYLAEYDNKLNWLDFPFIYPDKQLDFYNTNQSVGFKIKITDSKFSIMDGSDDSAMQWNAERITIFPTLTDPDAVAGGMYYDGSNYKLGFLIE